MYIYMYIYIYIHIFIFYLSFCSCDIHNSQDSRGKGGPFLIPLYHFHLYHECLHISQGITAESSPVHITSGQTQAGNLWFLNIKC